MFTKFKEILEKGRKADLPTPSLSKTERYIKHWNTFITPLALIIFGMYRMHHLSMSAKISENIEYLKSSLSKEGLKYYEKRQIKKLLSDLQNKSLTIKMFLYRVNCIRKRLGDEPISIKKYLGN